MITSQTVIEKLEEIQNLGIEIDKFFRIKCEVWKKIAKHIQHAPIGECAFLDKKYPILIHGGTGAAITYQKAYAKPLGAWPDSNTTLRITFEVTFWDEEENREKYGSYLIDIPIDLVENYSDEKFDNWLGEKIDKIKAERKEKARLALEEAKRAYEES